jgi:hypothetical protein
MNIFVLDNEPILAAQYQCDKHVVKMVLESAQLLSTVQNKYGISTKYKPTHHNHPCTIWAGQSASNYFWLWSHAVALCEEYTFRYGKIHACEELIRGPLADMPPGILEQGLTPFAQAMPDKYRDEDPVVAYRDYYICEKASIATWNKNRSKPYWWIEL